MFIKRDRFLGKFKKGTPHIGEYEKNDIFSEEIRLVCCLTATPGEHKHNIKRKYKIAK